jgi:hypothetical protein
MARLQKHAAKRPIVPVRSCPKQPHDGLKSWVPRGACGFDSRPRHFAKKMRDSKRHPHPKFSRLSLQLRTDSRFDEASHSSTASCVRRPRPRIFQLRSRLERIAVGGSCAPRLKRSNVLGERASRAIWATRDPRCRRSSEAEELGALGEPAVVHRGHRASRHPAPRSGRRVDHHRAWHRSAGRQA